VREGRSPIITGIYGPSCASVDALPEIFFLLAHSNSAMG
jgi:hypothetical protein